MQFSTDLVAYSAAVIIQKQALAQLLAWQRAITDTLLIALLHCTNSSALIVHHTISQDTV